MKTQIEALFTDHEFFSSLMNGPCRPWSEKSESLAEPIEPSWINDEHSDLVTQALHDFMKDSYPFFTRVKVIIPPGVTNDEPLTKQSASRPRYILVTILDNSQRTYHRSFCYYLLLFTQYLTTWDIYQKASNASETDRMFFNKFIDPDGFALNSAEIEWVTLDVDGSYVDEPSDVLYQSNRYVLTEMNDPAVQKILEVYKASNEQK